MTTDATRLAAALPDRYRLVRELGAGGMATVWLADDVRHDRQVAIKILHPELSAVLGPERFLAEIKLTAALQHPHILPLFDSGSADGLLFYVMPYVEGETLRRRLERERQLPVADAVRIARDVADALAYAHGRGVVHRDIKPENILLQSGRPVVADFGIALAVQQAGGSRMTQTGLSLGTPQYMAPEQAMGEREIDARADVYALGAVTYEMLAGEPPFTGPSSQAIVARVLTEQPAGIRARRPAVPEHVEDAVLLALEKLPADRFGGALEFATALEGGEGARSGGRRSTSRLVVPASRARLAWPAVAALAGALALWGWLRTPPEPPAFPPSRLAIAVPSLGGASTGQQRQVALTPDGSTLLVNAIAPDGENRTLRMSLVDTVPVAIPGIAPYSADYAISTDGREFVAVGLGIGMRRYPITGGTGTPLPTEIPSVAHHAWAPDGSVWFSGYADPDRGVARVAPDGTVTRPLGDSLATVSLMQVLPDGRHALAVATPQGVAAGGLLLIDLETRDVTTLVPADVVEGRYTAGYLVLGMSDGTLNAIGFDLRTRRVEGGQPVRIAAGVATPVSGVMQFAVSANGTIAYVPEQPRSLVLADRGGAVREATREKRNFHAPMFSRDGRRLSVDFPTLEGRDVWVVELADGAMSRATFDGDGHDASWAPDGRSIVYASSVSGTLAIRRARPGQAGSSETLFESRQLGWAGVTLPDGSGIVTAGNALASGSSLDVGLVRNGGKGPIEPIVATRFQETHPEVSPDGKWIVFQSDQSGRLEIYARRLEGNDDLIQVSTSGGMEPVWSRDGREIFYRSGAGGGAKLLAVSVTLTPAFAITARRELFLVSDMASATPHRNYDVSPDGRTFAFVRFNPATRVMIIQNLPALVAALRSENGTP
jgi:hypothetical protein